MTTDSELSACGYSTGITAGEDGFGIAVHVDDLTPDQARDLATSLSKLADQLTQAHPDGLRAVQVMLDALNEAGGTSHTLESVAASLGIGLAGATKAYTRLISRHIGGVLMPALRGR